LSLHKARGRTLDADDSITVANTEEIQIIEKRATGVRNCPHRKIKQSKVVKVYTKSKNKNMCEDNKADIPFHL
jgi:hypothetical protein